MTHWSRVIAAGIMLLLFGMMVGLILMSNGGVGFNAGTIQFGLLKWTAFIMVVVSGVFLTADSLSEEKREGTLGLLFLTDLKGYDIVLGKLMSHSLQAFYGLLAMMPILALPLLSGGVTGWEFWKTMLVICNTLFLSLAVGMFVSCISREVLKAMNGAFVMLLIFSAGLPWLDLALTGFNASRFKPVTSIASPGWLFAELGGLRDREFWHSLAWQHAIGWGFMMLTCVLVPRCWHDKTVKEKGRLGSLWRNFSYGSAKTRLARRRKLLPINPVLWLASREMWLKKGIWIIIALCTGIILYDAWWDYHLNLGFWSPGRNRVVDNCIMPIWVVLQVTMALWVTSQACKFFVEAQRNGAMELMLVTPLTPAQIISGQRRALWRAFWMSLVFIVALQGLSSLVEISNAKGMNFGATPVAGNAVAMNRSYYYSTVARCGTGLLNTPLRLAALGLCGMWMGMRSRKVTTAVLKTLCLVCVIPWFIEIFGQGFFSLIMIRALGTSGGSTTFVLWNMFFMSAVELIKNVFFIWLSPVMLRQNFRAKAANSGISGTGTFIAAQAPAVTPLKAA
jgi:ABC-type transport system involved in cytochrome c biogenesis permease component